MRRHLWMGRLVLIFFACAADAVASGSLRVGNRVLVVGDSAATVTALLGKPSYKSHRGGADGSRRRGKRARAATAGTKAGEQWQYRHDGRVIVITLLDGRVSDIDERGR